MRTTVEKAILCLSLAVCSLVYADRSDVWIASTVRVQRATLERMNDGGCVVTVVAEFAKTDGGRTAELAGGIELGGANQAACLNLLDARVPPVFRAARGL